LLPLLLELIGAHIPVEAWPTQMGKSERIPHAREATQGKAAVADRPTRTADPAAPSQQRTPIVDDRARLLPRTELSDQFTPN
jgi:hypothetical protein